MQSEQQTGHDTPLAEPAASGITYNPKKLVDTTADGIQVYTLIERIEEDPIDVGNRAEGYKPRIRKRELFFVKLQGVKVRGENLEEALTEVRLKHQRRMAAENTPVDLAYGLSAGLSETCIRNFCIDNDIDPSGSMTRAALRNIVLKRRQMNAKQYGQGLKRVGIHIGASR